MYQKSNRPVSDGGHDKYSVYVLPAELGMTRKLGRNAMPDYDADAGRVFDCLQAGGIAIVHMDVAYAIMSGTEDALRRVYAAKCHNL